MSKEPRTESFATIIGWGVHEHMPYQRRYTIFLKLKIPVIGALIGHQHYWPHILHCMPCLLQALRVDIQQLCHLVRRLIFDIPSQMELMKGDYLRE